jgi:putative transposase
LGQKDLYILTTPIIEVPNPIPLTDIHYINFIVAAQCGISCVKAAECYSKLGIEASHDTYSRFLTRQFLTPDTLWNEVKLFVESKIGWLIVDDSVLDKIHSEKIALTYYQWSGKNHKVVKGIGLITLVWTDGIVTIPIDYRIYDKNGDHKTKNEHLRDMVITAANRGFQPSFVMFDSWYSGVENLKFLKNLGWLWFTRVKKNRAVNPDGIDNGPVESISIPDDGIEVHLKKYGFIKLFHTKNQKGKDRFWATNFLPMDGEDRKKLQAICWSIENYHRAIKEVCGVEKCQARKAIIQRNHINCSLRAYIRLEIQKLIAGISPYATKWFIEREGIISYLQNPKYAL